MTPVRVGVIGVGCFGRLHAEKYADLHDATLVGVMDVDQEAAAAVAARMKTHHFRDLRNLLDCVEAVSVAVPAKSLYEVASESLQSGVDVLVEKPMAATSEEAESLARQVRRSGHLFQVGYLERFNPVIRELRQEIGCPESLVARRFRPFTSRTANLDVVFDLMIHDIDLALCLLQRPLRSVEATGESVVSRHIDVARARLEFEGGCVAFLESCRASAKATRRLVVRQGEDSLEADLTLQRLERRGPRSDPSRHRSSSEGQRLVPAQDLLQAELTEFISNVRCRTQPSVSVWEGLEALRVAEAITDDIHRRGSSTSRFTGELDGTAPGVAPRPSLIC